jgi:hypothetical protein
MDHTTTVAIRIFIGIALAASMVVAGISLASLQQQLGYAAKAEKHEQNTIQNVSDNFEKRNAASQQHMDQENLCLRAGECSNSNVGEQTLGNDNSVTGFSDQSKNEQAAVTPTPVVKPIATPTPTPTPPTALGCGTDAADVTLQSPIASQGLPKGTVLCLKGAGPNTGITAVLPSGAKVVADIIVDGAASGGVCPSPLGPNAPSPFVPAAVTSGTLPAPVSGTVICVG